MANIPFVDDLSVNDLIGTPASMTNLAAMPSATIPAGTWRNFKSVDWFFNFAFDPATSINKIFISFGLLDPAGNFMGHYNMESASLLTIQRQTAEHTPNFISANSNYQDFFLVPPSANPGSIVIDLNLMNLSAPAGATSLGFVLSTPIIGDSLEVGIKLAGKPGSPGPTANDQVWVGYLRRAHREWVSY